MNVHPISLDEIAANPAIVGSIDLNTRMDIASRINRIQTAMMVTPLPAPPIERQSEVISPPYDSNVDRLLDTKEAAGMLGICMMTLYRNKDRFPFTRRIGRRLMFSSNGIQRFMNEGENASPRRRRVS